MAVHELKDEIKYFEMARSGKMPFIIVKRDKSYQVDDELLLRSTDNGLYVFKQEIGTFNSGRFRWKKCKKAEADSINENVLAVETHESLTEQGYCKRLQELDIPAALVMKVLVEYFHSNFIPEGYVLLKTEMNQ